MKTKILELLDGISFLVNDDGRVFSLNHNGTRKNGRIDNRKGRELKPSINKYGYLQITISNSGIRKTYLVHRIVATAFIPNPSNKPTVNHLNGNKQDNRDCNLEWATYKEQKSHAIQTNLCNKNIDALKLANKKKSICISYDGMIFKSINEAKRKIGVHGRVIKRNGVVLNDNSNS